MEDKGSLVTGTADEMIRSALHSFVMRDSSDGNSGLQKERRAEAEKEARRLIEEIIEYQKKHANLTGFRQRIENSDLLAGMRRGLVKCTGNVMKQATNCPELCIEIPLIRGEKRSPANVFRSEGEAFLVGINA